MRALLVIDVQNGIVDSGDFRDELSTIERIIKDFKSSGSPVIFMKHVEDSEESPLYRGSAGSELHSSVRNYAENVLEKQTPNSFHHTELAQTLDKLGVEQLVIVGFEFEFCCMFTAISAFDRGYRVTLVKDAAGALNTAETYGMPGLDIKAFVSKVLSWSSVIEVTDYEPYAQRFQADKPV